MSSHVLVDRLQFTLTVTFHYLFPILTMGPGLFIAWLKTVSYLGREDHRLRPLRKSQAEREDHEAAARFWAKILAVNFAIGVVSGIPLEFQFGTGRPRQGQRSRALDLRAIRVRGLVAEAECCSWPTGCSSAPVRRRRRPSGSGVL